MWVLHYSLFKQGLFSFWPVFWGGMILLFFLFAVWYTWREQRASKNPDKMAVPFLVGGTLFAAFWVIGVGIDIGNRYFELATCLRNCDYEVVEGLVENYNPNAPGGHYAESFTVNGVPFKYGNATLIGFHKTKRYGGPIDEGKYVRIFYRNRLILKLWIRE
ncbi:MAG: hypothetical protein IPJ40_11725 [Saprospirales bacterium]|nr:hypothetical protein [Saprospirales bacterium]